MRSVLFEPRTITLDLLSAPVLLCQISDYANSEKRVDNLVLPVIRSI